MDDVDVELVRRLTVGARERAVEALDEARALRRDGHPDPAFVWAVRAAEIFIRDFVLTPHYLLEGLPWARASKRAAKVLGPSNWTKAFAKATEWYGPFDEPLTTDDRNAWEVWEKVAIRIRGDVIHGRTAQRVSDEEAEQAIDFVDRMISCGLRGSYSLATAIPAARSSARCSKLPALSYTRRMIRANSNRRTEDCRVTASVIRSAGTTLAPPDLPTGAPAPRTLPAARPSPRRPSRRERCSSG